MVAVLACLECEGETVAAARGFAISAFIYALLAFGVNPFVFENKLLITTAILHVANEISAINSVAVRTAVPLLILWMFFD